jgi:hypothetical protein
MSKEELVKDILSNYSKKDIVFIKKYLSDSLKKEKITVEISFVIYESLQDYPKKTYTFYDVKEATKFFDDLRKDAIRNCTICYMVAYGESLKKISLQIMNGDFEKKFYIDGVNQDWIYMTDRKIAGNRYELDQKKKNQHLFLDDEGKFLSWVRSNKCV